MVSEQKFDELCANVAELREHLIGTLDKQGMIHHLSNRVAELEKQAEEIKGLKRWILAAVGGALVSGGFIGKGLIVLFGGDK